MPRLESFDWASVTRIQNEINEVLRQIGEAHGINIELERVRFDKHGFRGYLEAQTTDPSEDTHGGGAINRTKKYRDDFLRNCKKYGFNEQHLGITFLYGKKYYKIIGLQSRAKRYKVIVEQTGGRTYRLTTDSVKKALNLI